MEQEGGAMLAGLGGQGSFPVGGTQEDKQRQCVGGRVFLVEVKMRGKVCRWDQSVQGQGTGGGSEGRRLGCSWAGIAGGWG